MAKQGTRPPIHVRIARTIRREMEKHLDEKHDKIIDIHFRLEASPAGPPGWNVIIERTVLGQSSTHGINFAGTAAPSAKDVGAVAPKALEALEEAVRKNSLIVKPGEVKKVIGRG